MDERRTQKMLDALAADLGVDAVSGESIAKRAEQICVFKQMKSIAHPIVIQAAEASGRSAESIAACQLDVLCTRKSAEVGQLAAKDLRRR